MDDKLRRLERLAALGDPEAEAAWRRENGRRGLYFRDRQPHETLTQWEESQEDYDEIFWHAKGPKYFAWWSGCPCCQDWGRLAAKLTKAHHVWGHRWGGQNSKRKTLRTHRDGSRKNYRLRSRDVGVVA